MQLGDIYKRVATDHFIVIQSFATYLNDYKNKTELENDILIVASPLIIVDGMLASDPARCYIGTQKEIEEGYYLYLSEAHTDCTKFNANLEDISLKIQQQNKIDNEEIDKMFTELEPEIIENLKRDIDKIIQDRRDKQ